jgi:L-gulono-1,4-lactone dehydrogenase
VASEWRNWTGDQRCTPAAVHSPRSLAELREAVGRASERGLAVRAAGSGHSFTGAALTEGAMIRIEALNRVLAMDSESGLVRVEAGITLSALSAALWDRGLALENLGDIDRQTLAGAISTATHGTGARFRNVSAQVEALELVLADGSLLSVSSQSEPDAHLAARVGLGALGVIYSATLRAVPAFVMRRVDSPMALEETLASIDQLAGRNDHFEFYVFPYTDTALVIERNRVKGPGPPRPRGRVSAYVNEILIENRAMDVLSRIGRRYPATIPRLARFASRQFSRNEMTDRSYRVFASERRVRFTEMEYAIPREHGAEAVRRVLALVRERRLPVGFPIEFRVVAPDDAYLSTAYGRETAYVAVHQYQGAPWREYFQAVEEIMASYGGRPHWGKRHFQTAAALRGLYPRWDDFQRVRARLDPRGIFTNAYTDRVLGPVRT